MVTFRFHLTSMVAVFLSLALGVLIGISLADDEGIRSEQRAMIAGIERSLDNLRAENTHLQGELLNFESALAYYDEVLSDAGKTIVGSRLTGRRITLFFDASAELPGQELRHFLRTNGVAVTTVVWDGQSNSVAEAPAALPPMPDLVDLLLGTGIASVLEPLVASGQLRFDGSIDPVDAVIMLVNEPNERLVQMAQTLTKQPMQGFFASIGRLPDEAIRHLINAGWQVVHYIETVPGRVRLGSLLASYLDEISTDGAAGS